MTHEMLVAYCLTKGGAYLDLPFGPIPICIKVGGHIFAQIYPKAEDFKVTLKCDPLFGDHLRKTYPGTVLPGCHCPDVQKPFWNTIYLNRDVSDTVVFQMADHAYIQVVNKLPRKVRETLKMSADADD